MLNMCSVYLMNPNSIFNMSFNVGHFQPLILIACFLSSIYSQQLFQTFDFCIFPPSFCVCCLTLPTHLVLFCQSELVCFWIFDVLINLSSLWYVIWSCCPLFYIYSFDIELCKSVEEFHLLAWSSDAVTMS